MDCGGSVSGLRARGGFEIVNMQWKDGMITRLVIKSTLGGNLRIRVPNELKKQDGSGLIKGSGENSNPFYYVQTTPEPVVVPESTQSLY